MDDRPRRLERTGHDYVQRCRSSNRRSRCNARLVMTPGEGEGGLMVPRPPAGSDRAGRPRSYPVGESPTRRPHGNSLIVCARESAPRALSRFRNRTAPEGATLEKRKTGGRSLTYEFINY